MQVRIFEGYPSYEEYSVLHESAGWDSSPPPEHMETAFGRSLGGVVAREGGRAVGMARLLGDGVCYWHVQDVAVLPEYRGRGIGRAMMERLLEYVARHSPKNRDATVGLMCAMGKEPFYEKLGFTVRPSEHSGPAMTMQVKTNQGKEETP